MSFTTSQYISYNRPSFFEIMAQDRMIPSLKFATKYILTLITQRNPTNTWMKLLNSHEELFCLIQAFFEHHFLTNYNASFSEHLYGLKRVNLPVGGTSTTTTTTTTTTSVPRLTNRQKYISLFNVVIVPYLKNKLDLLYRRSRRQQQDHQSVQSSSSSSSSPSSDDNHSIHNHTYYRKFIKFLLDRFLDLWPYCSALYEGTFFVYMLFYLFKDTKFHSPLLHWQGLMLKRVSVGDLLNDRREMIISRLKQMSYFQRRGGLWNLVPYVLRLGYLISDYSTYFLLIMAFLFKFAEWWYASENQFKAKASINIPPPPKAPSRASGGIELPNDTSLCPLCRKKRKNPTLLSISGYAFCYTCIHQHVTKNSCCPVTLVAPVSVNHLRRLYEQ